MTKSIPDKPWRVGRKVPINVYEEERPICQCHTALDAQLIVAAVNDFRQHIADTERREMRRLNHEALKP